MNDKVTTWSKLKYKLKYYGNMVAILLYSLVFKAKEEEQALKLRPTTSKIFLGVEKEGLYYSEQYIHTLYTVSNLLANLLKDRPMFFFGFKNKTNQLIVYSSSLRLLSVLKTPSGNMSFWELPPTCFSKESLEDIRYVYRP